MLFDYWVKHVQIICCVCNEALHEMVRLQQEKQNELVKKSEVETKPSSISSQLKMCRDCNTYIMLCLPSSPGCSSGQTLGWFQSVSATWNFQLCLTCGYLHVGDMKCKCFQHWLYCSCCLSEDLSGRMAESIYLSDVRLFKHYATLCFMATTAPWRRAAEPGYSS